MAHLKIDLVTRTTDKTFKKNLRFHVKYWSRGKVQYLVFGNFLLVLAIFHFGLFQTGLDWTLDYNSMEF